MILSPSKNEKFDKANSYEEKASVLFTKDVGKPIGLAYEQYVKDSNVKKYLLKDLILFKFSQCKELFDKFLLNCDKFQEKDLDSKVQVYYDFLSERTPDNWLQEDCNYNNFDDIEDEDVEIDKKKYNINDIDIMAQNFTVQSIQKKYIYEEIDLNPAFQRSQIWTQKQKSLLIESLLINIPIPAFYIDARVAGKWNVIDGLQRLSTIMEFTEDGFPLVETEYLSLKGKRFSTLDRKYQRRIEDFELSFNLVRPGTPVEIAFNIFTRINTLGTPLSAQEIRHAMNMGTATQFLIELSKTPEFIKAITEKNHISLAKRMNDKALILRYLSFLLLGYEKKNDEDESAYSKNDMNLFLINGMKALNDLDYKKDKDILENIKQTFKDNMDKAYTIFGNKCFRKFFEIEETKKSPINIPLFETITFTITKYSTEDIAKCKEKIFNEFLILFNERDTDENADEGKFLDWITTATNNPDNVKKRFNKVQEVFKNIIGY